MKYSWNAQAILWCHSQLWPDLLETPWHIWHILSLSLSLSSFFFLHTHTYTLKAGSHSHTHTHIQISKRQISKNELLPSIISHSTEKQRLSKIFLWVRAQRIFHPLSRNWIRSDTRNLELVHAKKRSINLQMSLYQIFSPCLQIPTALEGISINIICYSEFFKQTSIFCSTF